MKQAKFGGAMLLARLTLGILGFVSVASVGAVTSGPVFGQHTQTRQAGVGPVNASRAAPADLERLLDAEKPDPARIASLTNEADAEPATGLSSAALARFHLQRANRRVLVGRLDGAIEDSERALRLARGVQEIAFPAQVGLGWLLFHGRIIADLRRRSPP